MDRNAFINAQRLLKANGWEHVHTAMTSDPNTKAYGMLFAKGLVSEKDSQEFWLNKDTLNNLPPMGV